jgi:hypothetical protein
MIISRVLIKVNYEKSFAQNSLTIISCSIYYIKLRFGRLKSLKWQTKLSI